MGWTPHSPILCRIHSPNKSTTTQPPLIQFPIVDLIYFQQITELLQISRPNVRETVVAGRSVFLSLI
jgi:hypothetical protein